MTTLIAAIFLAYAHIEGTREAYYYHYKWRVTSFNVHDEHLMFSAQRSMVVMPMVVMNALVYGWFGLLSVIPLALCFSFVHNGAYYMKRNDLNPVVYKERFRAESTTTTAKVSMTYKLRLTLCIIGIVMIVAHDVWMILLSF